jgi:hypothetical protein
VINSWRSNPLRWPLLLGSSWRLFFLPEFQKNYNMNILLEW